MAEYKTYPTYKDSKIQWLGDIPEHWHLVSNRVLFKERNEPGSDNLPYLSVSIHSAVSSEELDEEVNIRSKVKIEDKKNYKLVKTNDIVFNMMRAWQGAIGRVRKKGMVSPAYVVAIPNEKINSSFFEYLYRTSTYIQQMNRFSKGISDFRKRLYWDEFKRLKTILPPHDDQTSIAYFLDCKTSEIASYIALKERTIMLLKERAVKMAINGFENPLQVDEWQDNFPNSWQIFKSKWIFKEIKIKNKPEKELLAVTQNRGVLPKSLCAENFVSPEEKGLSNQKYVPIDSFVISLRSFQGGIEYSNYEGIVSPAYTIFKLIPELDCPALRIFFKHFFKSKPFIELLNTIISGIRDGQNISYTDFSTLFLPIPDERTQEELLKLDSLIIAEQAQIEKEISLIKEYQQNLISEAVTGKIDVREKHAGKDQRLTIITDAQVVNGKSH